MNTSSNSNDGWQTVGGSSRWTARAAAGGGGAAAGGATAGGAAAGGAFRGWGRDDGASAGTAFSRGRREEDPRKEERRRAAEEQADREATAAREKKKAADAAAKKLADAINFTSEASYPSLGGAARPAPATATALNFSKTVADMAEREEHRLEEERKAAAAAAAEAARAAAARGPHRPLRYRGHVPRPTMYDEDADTYGDEFSDDGFEPEHQQMAYAGDEEEEGDSEFNADIGSTRRRGDKGIW